MAILPTAAISATAQSGSQTNPNFVWGQVQRLAGGTAISVGSQAIPSPSSMSLPVGSWVLLNGRQPQNSTPKTVSLLHTISQPDVVKNLQKANLNNHKALKLSLNSVGQLMSTKGEILHQINGASPGPVWLRLSEESGRPKVLLYRLASGISAPSEKSVQANALSNNLIQPRLEQLMKNDQIVALLQAVSGRSSGGLSQLLPNLSMLASPVLVQSLLGQLGHLRGRGPLVELAKVLVALKGRTVPVTQQASQASLIAALTELLGQHMEFQRRSSLDENQYLLYFALPYELEQRQKQLQLGVARYPEADSEFWLLTLKFELSQGALLMRARYQDSALQLTLISDSRQLAHRVDEHAEELMERLNQQGMTVQVPQCQVGQIPESIATPAKRVTYGAHGR